MVLEDNNVSENGLAMWQSKKKEKKRKKKGRGK